VAAIYDPVEEFYTMITSAFNWGGFNVTVIRVYEYKNIDLRSGDYLVIEGATERDEFLGIGGMEFVRYITLGVSVRTAESRSRVREITEKLRDVLRGKENWDVGGRLMLNVRIARQVDRSDIERGIYSQFLEVEWFEIEKRT
jgi:hypothetical protein